MVKFNIIFFTNMYLMFDFVFLYILLTNKIKFNVIFYLSERERITYTEYRLVIQKKIKQYFYVRIKSSSNQRFETKKPEEYL